MHHGWNSAAAAALAACLLAACRAEPAGTEPIGARLLARVSAAAGPDAGVRATPVPMRLEASSADVVSALAALPLDRVATRDAAVDRFLHAHFDGTCHPDDRFAFDEVCEYAGGAPYGDPSPWPSLMIGLRDGGIVTAVLVDGAAPLPGWRCDPVPGPEQALACVPPAVAVGDRRQWAELWSAFFVAAD